MNIAAGTIVAGGGATLLVSTPVSFICSTPSSFANPSTSYTLESHLLVLPLLSKASKAKRAEAEVSGMERVTEAVVEERGGSEASRVRKRGEWKSRRSELTQIFAP